MCGGKQQFFFIFVLHPKVQHLCGTLILSLPRASGWLATPPLDSRFVLNRNVTFPRPIEEAFPSLFRDGCCDSHGSGRETAT